MNPLLYLPFIIYSLEFSSKALLTAIIIPFITAFAGIYTSEYILKEYANPKPERLTEDNSMDLIPARPLKFEM